VDALKEQLRAIVGRDGLLVEPDELLVYECDGLTHYKARPRAVVFPRTTGEVSEVVRVLSRAGVSFAPRGAGTGLSGGALATDGGIVVELARMRRLLKLDVENRLAVVETGLVNAQLSRAAAPFRLHYAPDPSSQATCTIGGNIAENAGGIHCLKYGTTVDHVLAARVVLAGGEVVDLSAEDEGEGLDLLGVFVGSEGTFGIATEATLKLTPLAPATRTLLADFRDVNEASQAVSAIIASGLIPAALEMIDGATIRAVEASVFAAGLPLDAEAALLVELDGLEAGLDEDADLCAAICLRHGARQVRRARDEYERKRLWAARKGAFGAMGRISPDLMLQDAVVPRSRLPEVLAHIYRIAHERRLRIANVFHAGDGNLHPFICFDARDADEVARVHEAGREIMQTCVRAGGTITGEHGVGLDKSAYLPLVFSDDDLDAMLRLRSAFDPSGLCNPGKIIPAPPGCGEARAVVNAKHQTRRHTDAERQPELQQTLNDAPARSSSSTFNPSGSTLFSAVSTAERRVDAPSPPSASQTRRLRAAFAEIVGEEHVGEVIFDAERRALSVEPASAEEAAEVLRLASSANLKVMPAGGCTWLEALRPSAPVDVLLKTSRMARLLEHEPADLVATAQAGLTLDALNAELAHHQQWLPLDPPDDGRSTLGGIAATGLAGAHAFAYAAPRSHVLGMRVALADGRIIKTGGRVVKNVAGYDMPKLFVGSYGTLGLILEATFKLRPRPAREATIVAQAAAPSSLIDAGQALLDASLAPVALELLSPPLALALGLEAEAGAQSHALLVRFAGNEKTVEYQLKCTRDYLSEQAGINFAETLMDDSHLWRSLAAAPLQTSSALIWRARARPARLGLLLASLKSDKGDAHDALLASLWHASLGDGRLRVIAPKNPDLAVHVDTLRRLRDASHQTGVHLALEQAPPELKHDFDATGVESPTARLAVRVKQRLDPHATFWKR
jgi:glycolate oxidase subunit GlcD